MSTNHRRNTKIVQSNNLRMKLRHRHYQQHQRRDNDPNNEIGGANCCYYYDKPSPTLIDSTKPCDLPAPHKMCRKNPLDRQFFEDQESIEYTKDDSHNSHTKYNVHDNQLGWSRKNISATMERFKPVLSPSSTSGTSSSTSHHSPNTPHNIDYSYAYYEPGAIMCHSNIPTPEEAGPSTMLPRNSMRALSLINRNQRMPMSNRHIFHTRYAHENIYEDIPYEKHSRRVSSAQSLNNEQGCTKKEFQNILSNHYRVLEELNLSVEELLMSSSLPAEPLMIKRTSTVKPCIVDTIGQQITSIELTNEHTIKSPINEIVVCEDSGFSGSSSGASCSYVGGLRKKKSIITRSLRRSSEPSCESISKVAIYGSCRTSEHTPSLVIDEISETNAGIFVNHNDDVAPTIKLKNKNNLSQKKMKFFLWDRRS